ncbi:putative cell division cycle ATPase [Colletotrichum viniferum]|nr:putative cell division cycle ATPase [Colletotrichum viniferum]
MPPEISDDDPYLTTLSPADHNASAEVPAREPVPDMAERPRNAPETGAEAKVVLHTEAIDNTLFSATPPLVDGIDTEPSDDNEEVESDVDDLVRRTTYRGPISKAAFQREKNMGRFRLRARQAALDHNLTSMRLEDLERDLEELKKVILSQGDDWEPPSKSKFPVYQQAIHRVTMDRFRPTHSIVTSPSTQKPALEILVQELNAMDQDAQSTPKPMRICPERLRIRSRGLLAHLDKVSGGSVSLLGPDTEVDGKQVFSSRVFLRPFKYFVRNYAAIAKSIEELHSKAQEEVSYDVGGLVKTFTQQSDKKQQLPTQKDIDSKVLLEDAKLLKIFMDEDLKPVFDLRSKIEAGTNTEIEYADLWHLFRRGDLVVKKSEPSHALRVMNIVGGREPLSYRLPGRGGERILAVDGFVLDCISFRSDGSAYVPQLTKLSIKKYYGSLPISSLSVYPMQFHASKDDLRSQFLDNGKRYVEITRSDFCHKMLRGKTLDEPSHDVDGQVIVDMTLALYENRDWRNEPYISMDRLTQADRRETYEESWCVHGSEGCCGGDYIDQDLDDDNHNTEMFLRKRGFGGHAEADLLEEDFMLMQHYVYAFVLRSRRWITVKVSDLYDVEFTSSFNDLVLPENHGSTVRALVDTHERSRASQPSPEEPQSIASTLDIVKGKGAGLIILLHGPPGVGKTSTAECVADDTHRPLFPITCGDLGETAIDVEDNLQHNFRLAYKWGCVLLLDEADVFLAKRSKSELRHNAVTSVFLRSLEYYAGILFLTTNRVGAIDPAFKSRIQMSLFYPTLSLSVTKELYKRFINRAKEEQMRTKTYQFEIRKSEILRFAKAHFRDLERKKRDTWNGRQIRNAFQTAIALAEHKSKKRLPGDPLPVLGEEQFRVVASGFKEFDDYLVTTLGATEAEWAKRDHWRADGWYMGIPPQPYATNTHGPFTSSPQAMHHKQPQQPPGPSGNVPDTSSDDSDSDLDSDDETRHKQAEKVPAVPTILTEQPDAATSGFNMEEFQAFLKFRQHMAPKKQIRNAFQTAIALAEHKAKKRIDGEPVPILGEEQFKIVAEGYAKFDEYLVSAMGASEAEWANRDRWRADLYTTSAPRKAIKSIMRVKLDLITTSQYHT